MANQTEYIFEKDFWGNWKLVPKKSDSGIGWIILLLIVVVIVCLAIITLPLWLALLGFKMVKTKRYYAGIGSLLALLYFIIDIQNRWITGFLFLGYNDSAGKFTEGLIGEKQIMYVYVANGIGVLLGLYFIVQAYLLNKESNALNNSTYENETSSANSQSSNDFSISTSKPKSSSNQVNLVLGILGVVFAIAVIYFSFNKKVVNNEVPINNIEVNNEQPAINESPINENLNNNVSEQEYNEPISQDDLLNFITQYYTDISSNNFLAENYFSENVIQYINKKNTTPSDINSIHNNNNEFIDGKSTIINNEINFDRTEGEINYYNYWIDFNCFRKSKNKYQNCKVRVEIGIDSKNKIKLYRELEVTDLKFTTNEVSIERDPRSKDVSNVFYDPNYTLFDLLTDEPILPNSEGQYNIWYSSNEDPSPYNIVLSKNELSSHRYYKFKTKANCEQWCNNKKSNN
ncbi:hypothetical protein GCM10011508_21440 [Flavobacterium lutivivi]|nr:hypothetical protein GCM10011508_21440 [Flavobacterium lutivivi]